MCSSDLKQTGNAEAVARIKEKAAQRAMDLQGIVEGIKRSGAERFIFRHNDVAHLEELLGV